MMSTHKTPRMRVEAVYATPDGKRIITGQLLDYNQHYLAIITGTSIEDHPETGPTLMAHVTAIKTHKLCGVCMS